MAWTPLVRDGPRLRIRGGNTMPTSGANWKTSILPRHALLRAPNQWAVEVITQLADLIATAVNGATPCAGNGTAYVIVRDQANVPRLYRRQSISVGLKQRFFESTRSLLAAIVEDKARAPVFAEGAYASPKVLAGDDNSMTILCL